MGTNLGFWQARALRLLSHPKLDIAVGLLILVNAICLGIETDLPEPKHAWQTAEIIFCCLFVSELSLRMIALRCRFLLDPWCIFDSIIVGVSLCDVVMSAMGGSSSLSIVTVL